MGKLKELITLRGFSIRNSFIILTFITLLFTIFILTLEFALFAYLEETFNENGSSKLYSRLLIIVVLVTVGAVIVAESIIFYRLKLKKPISIIVDASNRITQNDLNFHIGYESKDEFGQLCSSFEKMRATLENNFLRMWQADEEQKRFFSSFIHDINTPLTVINGYIDIMENYIKHDNIPKEKYKNALDKMKIHISRIQIYSQKIYDLHDYKICTVKGKEVSTKEFINIISEATKTLSIKSSRKILTKVLYNEKINNDILNIDISTILRVLDNILVNALRYATKVVTIYISFHNKYISIEITDDGNGFSGEDLLKAKDAFYKGENGKSGLGLYISNLLCKKHRGKLEISNYLDGGKVTVSFREIDN